MRKKLTVGILAHVDAGKTTLSEALLFLSGKIRKQGRVDHKNTYLDTNAVERERGITVFSKQARFSSENCDFILLDTPGHVDFSPEAERVLSLLDYAILVISAPDGVQSHTKTLWNLLEFYRVPTFVFVNKTDISTKLKEETAEDLCENLSEKCVSFYDCDTKSELDERLAVVNEGFLETFLGGEEIANEDIAELVCRRELFPCFFGSALKLDGVDFFLRSLDRYTLSPKYPEEPFGAAVYKISRADSVRLTYMKVTSGCLSVRDEITYTDADGNRFSEKISQIRLYSGEKFEQCDNAHAGEVCAVVGLSATYAGLGLGAEENSVKPCIEPVLSYTVCLPPECDPVLYYPKLKELEEEEPSLHLRWNDSLRQIEAGLMGEIQIDLLKRMISDRFAINCEFGEGCILYKEKPASKSLGIGHFEPLRHYAEVQLLIEPQPKGSGLIFDARLDENSLDPNYRRLILSVLYEKDHRGTLTGAPLTDAKITLVAGRAHQKHTEGGDFREATLRAVRQGLMKSGCVLLEPYYKFSLELPSQNTGRAISDLSVRAAEFEIESATDGLTVIKGRGPAATLGGYQAELTSYTRGQGRLYCHYDGYEPCHNSDEIISAANYDPCADLENTPHSVFCSHGAGFVVPWNEVDEHKHIDLDISTDTSESVIPKPSKIAKQYNLSNEELEAIMLREFGPIRRKQYSEPKTNSADGAQKKPRKKAVKEQRKLIIVDGYNLIFSHEELKKTAEYSLEKAREELMDILSNYVAYTKTELVLVFDAYLVKDGAGEDFTHDGYRVVFTKHDETADSFIEKMMNELGPDYNVTVVTGDRLLQFSAVHSGVLRMTTDEFFDELTATGNRIIEFIRKLAEK
ncbi:MAG: NYN domain-containing protein [Clostridia bacterium]|nr:NYN domain-containing protein [Clostridia bacterium]